MVSLVCACSAPSSNSIDRSSSFSVFIHCAFPRPGRVCKRDPDLLASPPLSALRESSQRSTKYSICSKSQSELITGLIFAIALSIKRSGRGVCRESSSSRPEARCLGDFCLGSYPFVIKSILLSQPWARTHIHGFPTSGTDGSQT